MEDQAGTVRDQGGLGGISMGVGGRNGKRIKVTDCV